MIEVSCPICENMNELKPDTKEGARFSCQTCFAQLALKKAGSKFRAVCALCKKANMDCATCDELEMKRAEKDLI